MKASEFRIGNLIYDFDEHTFYPIEEIKKNSQGNMCVIYRNGSFMSTDPIPMKLTEEWLLKFGFEYHHDTPHPNRVFRKNWDEGFFELEEIISFYYGGNFTSVNVNHVHQLQNLFFALTGGELKIKEL